MRYTVFLCLYFGGFCSLSIAAEPTQISTSDEEQIKTLYAHYMQRYNHYLTHSELPLEQKLYANQIMVMNGQGSNVLTNDLFNEQVVVFLNGLKSAGVAKVNWQDININMLSERVAIVSNVAVRFTANGEVYNKVGATYMITKNQDKWLISAFTVHNADNVISV